MTSPRIVAVLAAIARPLDWLAIFTVMSCMAALSGMIIVQVISRYFFNVSFALGWEVPRLAFIVMIFISIPLAYREGKHVGIGFLMTLLPTQLQSVIVRLCCATLLAFLIILVALAYSMAVSTWDQYLPTLPIPVGIFYASIVFSCVHLMIYVAQSLIIGTFAALHEDAEFDTTSAPNCDADRPR